MLNVDVPGFLLIDSGSGACKRACERCVGRFDIVYVAENRLWSAACRFFASSRVDSKAFEIKKCSNTNMATLAPCFFVSAYGLKSTVTFLLLTVSQILLVSVSAADLGCSNLKYVYTSKGIDPTSVPREPVSGKTSSGILISNAWLILDV